MLIRILPSYLTGPRVLMGFYSTVVNKRVQLLFLSWLVPVGDIYVMQLCA